MYHASPAPSSASSLSSASSTTAASPPILLSMSSVVTSSLADQHQSSHHNNSGHHMASHGSANYDLISATEHNSAHQHHHSHHHHHQQNFLHSHLMNNSHLSSTPSPIPVSDYAQGPMCPTLNSAATITNLQSNGSLSHLATSGSNNHQQLMSNNSFFGGFNGSNNSPPPLTPNGLLSGLHSFLFADSATLTLDSFVDPSEVSACLTSSTTPTSNGNSFVHLQPPTPSGANASNNLPGSNATSIRLPPFCSIWFYLFCFLLLFMYFLYFFVCLFFNTFFCYLFFRKAFILLFIFFFNFSINGIPFYEYIPLYTVNPLNSKGSSWISSLTFEQCHTHTHKTWSQFVSYFRFGEILFLGTFDPIFISSTSNRILHFISSNDFIFVFFLFFL